MGSPDHSVQFYDADDALLDELEEYVGSGLAAGEGVVVIATGEHRERVEERLMRGGIDVRRARSDGQYLAYDAHETLRVILGPDGPDPRRFVQAVAPALTKAGRDRRHVRAFGEMVAILWERGQSEWALRLESFWNDLGRTRSFALLCAYPMRAFRGVAHRQGLLDVCGAHGRVIPAESYPALGPPDERNRAILLLQQKASSWDGIEPPAR